MKFLPRIMTRPIFWLIVAGVLLLYTLAGFLLVPRIVQGQLRQAFVPTLQREAQVGEVRFNPFTFVLEVRDFSVPDADGRPMLAWQRFMVDFELISILRRAYSFAAIALDQPSARLVVRADGSLNFVDLAPKPVPGEAPAPPPPATDQALPRLFIEAFTVNGGRVDFEDQSRPSPFAAALSPITFALRNFSTTGAGDNAYQLDAESERGERLSWHGTLNAEPLASSGAFTLTNVQATTLWDYLRDAVGFQITAGTLDLSGRYGFSLARQPLDLVVNGEEIRVRDLHLRPKGSDVDEIAVGELLIKDAQASVADRTVQVGRIGVTGGNIACWLDPQGSLSLARLAGPLAASSPPVDAAAAPAASPAPAAQAPPGSAPPEKSAAPAASNWRIQLPLIETSAVAIAFEDRRIDPALKLTIAPLNVKVAGYDSAHPGPLDIDAHIGIGEKGQLATQGKFDLSNTTAAFAIDLSALDLRPSQAYLTQYTDMTLTSGTLAFKGKVDVLKSAQGAVQPKVTGSIDITKFRTIDNALEQDFVRWERLLVTGFNYDGARPRLRIDRIDARKPYARVIIASNGTINISEVLKRKTPTSTPQESQPEQAPAEGAKPGAAAKAGAPASAAEKPLAASIGLVRFDKASANFADYSLTPNFVTGIQELSGTVKGLSSDPNSRAKVDLDGLVDAYAPVTIDGDINYLSAKSYTDLKLAFDNMELTTFTPYSGKFAGYRIQKGKLSVKLAYHIENGKLDAQHKVVLNQLQLGEKVESPEATHLPVKLAIALLKDRNGVIDLDLPVSGTLDDPKFKLGPVIWKVVTNLVTKIVTAPFALLGSLFGGGDEINQLTFAPGGSALQGESAARIESVLKGMQERPGLELEIPLAVNTTLDKPVLQRARLNDQLLAVKRRELLAKRKPVDQLDAAVLEDRKEYWRLLNELALQAQVLPTTDADGKPIKRKTPDADALEASITELEGLVVPTIDIPDADLAQLGKDRAQVVQDLLLKGGTVDPSRVFIITAPPAPIDGNFVKMELSLR